MSETTITKTVYLAAPPATVWQFLTDKDKLGQWFHRAEDDLQAGRPYVLLGSDGDGNETKQCWGEVLEMLPPERLVLSFTVKPLNGALTTVSFMLEPVQDGTQLTLVHEGVGAAAGAASLGLLRALDAGWDEHFARLRQMAT